jgi:hypothetical protein
MTSSGTLEKIGFEPPKEASGRALYVCAAVLAVAVLLPLVSTAFGVYDRVLHWGKFIHAADAACVAFIFGMLLLGWRAHNHVDLSDELVALTTIFVGILFGVLWEIVEFVWDWVSYSDLQKSNSDTMTDFLWGNLAAIAGVLIAMRVYCHLTTAADRERLGAAAAWLVDGPSRLLDRHGMALLVIAFGLIAAAVLSLWFAGRPVPGLPIP